MSNLEKHAEYEMRLAGMYEKDSDYAGMLPEAIMKMVRVFSEEGHSGFSAGMAISIFNRLARFQTLSPLTDNPDEWMEVSQYSPGFGAGVHQSRRDPSCFSKDGGKTYYSLDDKERSIKTTISHKKG